MEEVSGGRMHYMFNRVGGLKEELPAGWTGAGAARDRPRSGAGCRTSTTWSSATRSSGPAPAASASSRAETVQAYGVSGPIARASGVDFDLRRDEPYLGYGELGRAGRDPHGRRLPGPVRVPAGAGRTSRWTSPTPASTG